MIKSIRTGAPPVFSPELCFRNSRYFARGIDDRPRRCLSDDEIERMNGKFDPPTAQPSTPVSEGTLSPEDFCSACLDLTRNPEFLALARTAAQLSALDTEFRTMRVPPASDFRSIRRTLKSLFTAATIAYRRLERDDRRLVVDFHRALRLVLDRSNIEAMPE
jgi:hypothetical protein